MKKFFIIIGIMLLILLVLISCAPEPSLIFSNFVDDLDIEGRFSDAAIEIERGKGSDITINGINALIGDLQTMTLDNAKAKEITAQFIASCETLKESIKENSKTKLSDARETFQDAVKKEYDFSKTK